MTKLEELEKYCGNYSGEISCENCPVHLDENALILCQSKAFYRMTEEEQESLLRVFKGDMVNHPAHYETGKFECIDVMIEALGAETVKGFCLGNAFKYLYRCKHKNNEIEDIKKARWYIDKLIELAE